MAKKKKAKPRKISSRKVVLWLTRDGTCDEPNCDYELYASRPESTQDSWGTVFRSNGGAINEFCPDVIEQDARFRLKGSEMAKVTIEKVRPKKK